MRKVLGAVFFSIVLIMAVTGCNSKDNMGAEADQGIEAGKSFEGELSKGRYVEEDVVFPEGINPKGFIAITASLNGDIELYTYNDGSYERHLLNKKWSKAEAEALQKSGNFGIDNFSIRKIFYGEDKKQYLLGESNSDYHSSLYRLSDTGVFEKVGVKRFEDINEDWGNLPCRPEVIKVLENGMIAAAYPWGVIEVYSPDGQSMIGEYNHGKTCLLAAEGNTIYYTDQQDNEILSINMETKKEENPRSIENDIYGTGIFEVVDGTAYLCNTNGIHLNMEGASLWETLLDASQSSLSNPSERFKDFVIGSEGDYYIVLSNAYNSDISIKHIFYDENASSVPPIELSIFSIDDNPTIRQAINLFQESHPEVRIDFRIANTDNRFRYTYGIKNPKQTITLKDQINALNTELLAGKGPDILVLDGMPVESYIEKGVLEDMGSIFNPLKASGELLPNITDPYYQDGKVYTMPVRFKLPIILGTSDAVNAANSITELAEYARNSKEIPLLAPSNYRALAAWLFLTYYDQIQDQDINIDEAALQDFLETINTISIAIYASDDAKMNVLGQSDGKIIWAVSGYWQGGEYGVYDEKYQSNMEETGGMMDFALPLKTIQERQGTFSEINHRFKAYGLVGINSAGSQKELAKEFLQLLFSREVQSPYLYDGFPVNKAAMEEWVQKDVFNYFSTTLGGATVSVYYPEKEDRDKIYECICAANQPMVNDMTMIDMILDEAERYLRGDISSEQAASNIAASIHLYLSE